MQSYYEANSAKVRDSISIVMDSLGLTANGSIIPIEQSSSLAFSWLDMYCGIDWLLKTNDGHVLGIAARIQLTHPEYYHDPHNTFTIRFDTVSGARTEYAKRLEAIEKGYFYPFYTLQAYCKQESPTEFLSGALI